MRRSLLSSSRPPTSSPRSSTLLSHRRWLCRPAAAHRSHHLHLVDERTELDRHLRFRDRLRASATLRSEYAALKHTLAQRFRDDREAYTEAKAASIRRNEPDARGGS